MDSQLAVIKRAIDHNQHARARALLQEYINENPPSADAYYLASELATEDRQRRQYLDRAMTLDPFHPLAENALDSLEEGKSFEWEIVRDNPLSNVPAQIKISTQPAAPTLREVIAAEEKASVDKKDRKPYALRRYDLASPVERLIASVIDGLVLMLITAVLVIVASIVFTFLTFNSNQSTDMLIDQSTILGGVIGVLVYIWYPMRFLPAGGQTPGKRMMRIAVLKLDGSEVNAAEAVLRNIIGYTLSSFFMLGYLWVFGDAKRQGWHDKLAGTVVVRL